jgi:probable rRNA maturation factor
MTIEDAVPGANDNETPSEPPTLALDVQFAAPAFAAHRKLLTKAVLKQWVETALFDDAVLTLRFVDTDEGKTLNRTYRGKDYATNVLTFAYAESEDDPVTGDIVLCCPVVESEAQQQGKTLLAHYAHLVIHGVLHAQGYDHEDEEEAEEMEGIETELLESLGFADPYADDGKDADGEGDADGGATPGGSRVLH